MPSGGTTEDEMVDNAKYMQAKRLARIRQLKEVEAASGRIRSDLSLAQSAMCVAEKISEGLAFEADRMSDLTDPHDLLSSGYSMDQLNSILKKKKVTQESSGKWSFRTANDRLDAAWRTVIAQESSTCARDPLLSLTLKLKNTESSLASTIVDAFSLTLDVTKDTIYWLTKQSHTARLARVNLVAGKNGDGDDDDGDGDDGGGGGGGESVQSGVGSGDEARGAGDESIVHITENMKSVAVADMLIGAAVTFDKDLQSANMMDSKSTVRRQSLVRIAEDRPWVNSDLVIEQSRLTKEIAMTLSTIPGIRNRLGAPTRPPAWVAPCSATGQPADPSAVQSLAFGFNDLHIFMASKVAGAISFDTHEVVRKTLQLVPREDRGGGDGGDGGDDDDVVAKMASDRLNTLIPIPQYHSADAIRTTNTPIRLELSNSGTHRRSVGVVTKPLTAEEVESIRSTRSILAGRRLSASSLEVREAVKFRQNRSNVRITGDLFSYSTWANACKDICLRRGYFKTSEEILPLLDMDIGILQHTTARAIDRGAFEAVRYEADCVPAGVRDAAQHDDVNMAFISEAAELENYLVASWG